MKDSIGQALTVGDTVAYIRNLTPSFQRLGCGTVVGFTPTMVKVNIFGCRNDCSPVIKNKIPQHIVKISDRVKLSTTKDS